jgi:hypothetical protein
MRSMVRFRSAMALGISVLVVGSASTVATAAQSLAEVAKKERDRRARIQQSAGTAPVFGGEELAAVGGSDRSATGGERKSAREGASDTRPRNEGSVAHAAASLEDADRLTDKQARELRETWARVWQDRMDQARTELDEARNDSYQCQAASPFFYVPLGIDCDGVDLRLAEAEARHREVEQQRYNWRLLLPAEPEAGVSRERLDR